MVCVDGKERRYRRDLLRCLRGLVQESGQLLPSLYLCNTVREGKYPVRGGGYAVRHCLQSGVLRI